jgi:lipopolysaccharide transport system ATP-binding protein
MSSNDVVIKVDKVSKCYAIYKKPIDRLKQMAHSKFLNPIRKTNVTYYDEFWALRDISFDLYRGETLGILGQNGSGKSTLLQIIAGTLSPTCGTATIQGRVAALLELGSGFHPEFSGRENVYLNASVLGLSREQTDQKLDDILSFADIGAFVEQPVKTYSSGMMLRLAFAVQAAIETEVLIIDEALAVGDARFQLKCFKRLQDLKDKGTTILFVSHATELVRSFCDKGLLLDKGQVQYLGDANTATIQYFNFLFPNQENQVQDVSTPEPKSEAHNQEISSINENNCLFFDNFSDESKNTFGRGGAKLNWLKIYGLGQINVFSGGEDVTIRCNFSWDKEFVKTLILTNNLENNLTLGIAFMDSQGRYLFGCNGFDQLVSLDCLLNEEATATFQLTIPFLTEGNYFITVAIAVGTLKKHEQLKWYDALIELKCSQHKKNIFGTFAIEYKLNYGISEGKCA